VTGTSTSALIANAFGGFGTTIVTNIMPIGLVLFGGILLYFWGKRFLKKHLHS